MPGRDADRSECPSAGRREGSSIKRLHSDISSGNDVSEDKDLPQSNAHVVWADLLYDHVQALEVAIGNIICRNLSFLGTKIGRENQKLALIMLDHSDRVGEAVVQMAEFVEEYATRTSKKPKTEMSTDIRNEGAPPRGCKVVKDPASGLV